MRRLIFLPLFLLLVSCGTRAEKKAAEPENQPKKQEQQAEPVDLGDNTAPVEVRALKGAKEVKKRIDTQRHEDRKVVEEANQ